MKGTRITGFVFSIINTVFGLFISAYSFIVLSVTDFQDETPPNRTITYIMFTVTIVIFFVIPTIISFVNTLLLRRDTRSAAILVFGIISIITGNLVVGILMCVYFGLARKYEPNTQVNVIQDNPAPITEPKQEVTTRPKFCQYCGSALEENANFCQSCGAKIEK